MSIENLRMYQFLTQNGVELKSWDECDSLNPLTRMHMIYRGVIAFVNAHVSNTIFVVDSNFDASIAEYVFAHEFGHVLCRRNENDELTSLYNATLRDKSLLNDPQIRIECEKLKMQEELRVDLFAIYLMHNLGITPNFKEHRFMVDRIEVHKQMVGEEKTLELDEAASKMVFDLFMNVEVL